MFDITYKKIVFAFVVSLFVSGSIMPSVDVGTESKTRHVVWNSFGGVFIGTSIVTGIISCCFWNELCNSPRSTHQGGSVMAILTLCVAGGSGAISLGTLSTGLFCLWRGYKNRPRTEASLNKEICKNERKHKAVKERRAKLRDRKKEKLKKNLCKKKAETEKLEQELSSLET